MHAYNRHELWCLQEAGLLHDNCLDTQSTWLGLAEDYSTQI